MFQIQCTLRPFGNQTWQGQSYIKGVLMGTSSMNNGCSMAMLNVWLPEGVSYSNIVIKCVYPTSIWNREIMGYGTKNLMYDLPNIFINTRPVHRQNPGTWIFFWYASPQISSSENVALKTKKMVCHHFHIEMLWMERILHQLADGRNM